MRDWIVSMIAGDESWTNEVADDFGVLLHDDHRPDSALPPLTPFDPVTDQIVCDGLAQGPIRTRRLAAPEDFLGYLPGEPIPQLRTPNGPP
ncbi:MAG: hypothetical protein GY937_25665 [bacterium]|nr:hypothetical protein [bacterium]